MFAQQKPDKTILHNLRRVHDKLATAIPAVSLSGDQVGNQMREDLGVERCAPANE